MHPLCFDCKHYQAAETVVIEKSGRQVHFCAAFPPGGPGIPEEIFSGEHDHVNEAYPGDGGTLFETRGLRQRRPKK